MNELVKKMIDNGEPVECANCGWDYWFFDRCCFNFKPHSKYDLQEKKEKKVYKLLTQYETPAVEVTNAKISDQVRYSVYDGEFRHELSKYMKKGQSLRVTIEVIEPEEK